MAYEGCLGVVSSGSASVIVFISFAGVGKEAMRQVITIAKYPPISTAKSKTGCLLINIGTKINMSKQSIPNAINIKA